MFLLKWYKEWIEIRATLKQVEDKPCESCETLKHQLEIANYEKEKLLNRIMEKPEAPVVTEAPQITRPRTIPWNVRRQMLEREDRERARAAANAAKPDPELEKKETEEFEKELADATARREQSGS